MSIELSSPAVDSGWFACLPHSNLENFHNQIHYRNYSIVNPGMHGNESECSHDDLQQKTSKFP